MAKNDVILSTQSIVEFKLSEINAFAGICRVAGKVAAKVTGLLRAMAKRTKGSTKDALYALLNHLIGIVNNIILGYTTDQHLADAVDAVCPVVLYRVWCPRHAEVRLRDDSLVYPFGNHLH